MFVTINLNFIFAPALKDMQLIGEVAQSVRAQDS